MNEIFGSIRKLWAMTLGRIFVAILVGIIRFYYPSCSHYGLAAVKVHGAGKGSLLAAWRVLRCHPWATGGIEHIPAKGSWNNRDVIENSTNNDRQVIGA
jgi:putative membrane protein insertion efficiency factor